MKKLVLALLLSLSTSSVFAADPKPISIGASFLTLAGVALAPTPAGAIGWAFAGLVAVTYSFSTKEEKK
ncbi:MAG TPA: hypothetical protein VEM34_07765 [Burkholderiales bacterium]|nr:hypothetical protein [Burkholderiales bacterium]